MDKVAAGQLRMLGIDVKRGSRWIKAGTPYLVLGQPEDVTTVKGSISWLCLLDGATVSWHVNDVQKDALVQQ